MPPKPVASGSTCAEKAISCIDPICIDKDICVPVSVLTVPFSINPVDTLSSLIVPVQAAACRTPVH